LQWNRFLFEKVETNKLVDSWSRSPRGLISQYPDIILPSSNYVEVEKIFVAIDVSGSIDREAVKLFVNLVRNTPKQFQVEAITFDTSCQKLDLKDANEIAAGGGTSFYILEDYIQENCKKYPKAIFVLTDGYGDDISPQFPERWSWLLYGEGSTANLGNMTHHKIMEVLNEQ